MSFFLFSLKNIRNDSVIFRDKSSVFVFINNWQQFVTGWYLEFDVLFCSSLCQCELWETDVKTGRGVGGGVHVNTVFSFLCLRTSETVSNLQQTHWFKHLWWRPDDCWVGRCVLMNPSCFFVSAESTSFTTRWRTKRLSWSSAGSEKVRTNQCRSDPSLLVFTLQFTCTQMRTC